MYDGNFIIPVGSTCDSCVHGSICAIKSDFRKLCADSLEILKANGNDDFHLSAHCKYYELVTPKPRMAE